MSKLKVNGSFIQFIKPLRELSAFDTHGSLCGVVIDDSALVRNYGQLPREFYDSVDRADYIIFSYYTPIAWHVASSLHVPSDQTNCTVYSLVDPNGGEWVIPSTKYSVTTSKQQGRIHPAISQLANPAYV